MKPSWPVETRSEIRGACSKRVFGGNGSAAREFHHLRTVRPDHNRFLDLGLPPDVLMPMDKDLGAPEPDNWSAFSYLYCGHILNQDGVHRMYRWYLANPVRFQQSLKVEIQNQHTNGKPTTADADDYTSVAFWYQEEPHQALGLPSFKERIATSNTSEK